MATCEADSKAEAPVEISPKSYSLPLLENPHRGLAPPTEDGETVVIRGCFSYFHYGCDGQQDVGWGCGYRTLQSAISWIIGRRGSSQEAQWFVPSIREIQAILVAIGDKGQRFEGSRDWIGTLEEFYVMDVLYQVSCRILHARQLDSQEVLDQIRSYFNEYQGFIAMGGINGDSASKAIVGWHRSAAGNVYLLVVDPHFAEPPACQQTLIDRGYVRWMPIEDFSDSTYNLCLILQP
ncbi:probable Ufm1-specific protease 1 [Drosophila bipectinata]|uniref:probable Ufm1-specific protease 1 n=1 Tax=Drosophila bipectinata TaxID=42026 RepID=UPI001C89B495|nr:probable Ufm1-specific protease 1 [Drosophila bipectinata]